MHPFLRERTVYFALFNWLFLLIILLIYIEDNSIIYVWVIILVSIIITIYN